MSAIVVFLTAGSEEQANLLAEELVRRRLAGCVNIVPGIRSVYHWRGQVCRDGEWMLLVKTMDSEFEALEAAVRELHGYELPEILALPVHRGEENYLRWIEESLDKTAESVAESAAGSPIPSDERND